MDSWLTAARDDLADACGLDRESLDLSAADEATILDLARVAAHESGARTNAPLLCYLAGHAAARGASLDSIVDAVTTSSS